MKALHEGARMKAAVLVLALVLLAGCGKKGAPAAPGPADEIVFPKQYPSR
jgi:predicted small lipoprotein YifL